MNFGLVACGYTFLVLSGLVIWVSLTNDGPQVYFWCIVVTLILLLCGWATLLAAA